VAESIPLRTTLCVEGYGVVVYAAGGFVDDVVVEGYAVETWRGHFVQGPIDGDAGAVGDLLCGEGRVVWGEEVEHAELVGGVPETPGIAVRAIGIEGERGEGRACGRHETEMLLVVCIEAVREGPRGVFVN
jgi:hypothetical protein